MKIGHWIPAYNEQVNVNILSQALMDSMVLADQGHNYRFWAQHSCDLVWMRNNALDRALTLGLDYLLMQDADCYCDAPGGIAAPLLATAEKTGATVTGALVTMRTDPPKANVWPVHPGKIYECDKIGTGIVLINLNKVREWYDDYAGPCFFRTYETDKGVKQAVGLDIFFSYVVKEHGLLICDATVPTVHVNAAHRLRYEPAEMADSIAPTAGAGDRA